MRLTRLTALTLALGIILASAACGGDEEPAADTATSKDALLAAAKQEGELTWYTTFPAAFHKKAIEGFEAEYGIDVTEVYLTQGALTQRFASEQDSRSSAADFFNMADGTYFERGVENGWFKPVTRDSMPSLADWPAEALLKDTYAVLNIQPLGFAYNSQKAPTKPTTWQELADPAFKGQVVFGDTIPSYLPLYKLLREKYGDAYLSGLNAQDLRVVESMVPGAQQLAAGEMTLAVPALASVIQPLIDEKAPLKLVVPADTTGVEQYGAVVATAKHPNAARLFMDYLLSPAGQERLTNGIAASMRAGIPNAMELPAQYVSPNIDAALEDKDALRSLLGM